MFTPLTGQLRSLAGRDIGWEFGRGVGMRNTTVVVIELLFIALVMSTPGRAQQNPVLSPPAGQVYLGIWADPDLGTDPDKKVREEQSIEIREGQVNRTFALHLHYYGWTALAPELDSSGVFQPDPALQGDVDHGRIPVISWGCDDSQFGSDGRIAAGDPDEDANILATAKALGQYPGPVLLRWFWEFNVLSNPNRRICRGDYGNPTPQVYADFIGAWRHIRQLFRQAGAVNVFFVWNPGNYDALGDPKDPHNFYPGNGFVDWIAIDSYQRSKTAAFTDDFDRFYTDFSEPQYGHKPMMVGENASYNYSQYGMELQWTYLQGLLADVQAGMYPLLKGYCYFDSVGQNGDWVLDDNNGQGNGGLAALAIMGASAQFSAMPSSFSPH